MLVLMLVLVLDSCIRGKRITKANVDQVTEGMSKKQVESILGPPTSSKTEDFVIMKKDDLRLPSGQRHGHDRFQGRQSAVEGQHVVRLIRCSVRCPQRNCPQTRRIIPLRTADSTAQRDLPRITALG